MATEKYTTLGESTLNGAISSGATSLTVASASSFPTAGNFRIRIDNEIFKVTAVAAAVFTVVGAQEGTSAIGHSSGATVTEVLTASALDAIRSDISLVGALASLPASGMKSGDRYYTDDGAYNYVYDGSSWRALYGGRIVVPPVAADFSWVNQGTASVSSADGTQTLYGPGTAGTQLRMRVASVPGSTPWTADALLAIISPNGNFRAGLVLRESGTGKLITCGAGAGTIQNIVVDRWSSPTTFTASTAAFSGTSPFFPEGFWLRAKDDGTNILFYLSTNGRIWTQIHSVARTTPFTTAPDQIGIFFDSEATGSADQIVSLIHLKFG